jgi:hypothetical protein
VKLFLDLTSNLNYRHSSKIVDLELEDLLFENARIMHFVEERIFSLLSVIISLMGCPSS